MQLFGLPQISAAQFFCLQHFARRRTARSQLSKLCVSPTTSLHTGSTQVRFSVLHSLVHKERVLRTSCDTRQADHNNFVTLLADSHGRCVPSMSTAAVPCARRAPSLVTCRRKHNVSPSRLDLCTHTLPLWRSPGHLTSPVVPAGGYNPSATLGYSERQGTD